MFCFRLFDYAGERNYKESGEKKVRERVEREWRNVKWTSFQFMALWQFSKNILQLLIKI